jgi:hypothetical protein
MTEGGIAALPSVARNDGGTYFLIIISLLLRVVPTGTVLLITMTL